MKHRALRQRGGRQSGEEKARRTTGDLVAAAEAGSVYGAHRGRGSVWGAAGGGKSDALIIEALRQVHIPHYRALILRKTYPQLSELIDKTMRYYKPVFPKARYNGSSHCWTFPSGAKIYFGSLNHTQDKYNYQGKAFDFIGVDELTHFTWDEYSYVMSRNRPSGPGTRCTSGPRPTPAA